MRYPLARRAPLAHPVRRAILENVRARPGVTASALAQALGTDWKTAFHHARVLAALGHLEARRDGRLRRFFPREAADRSVLPPAAVETATRVLALALRRPGSSLQDLGAVLGVPQSTLRWHVQRLHERGLLAPAGAGWAVPPAMREPVREAVGSGPEAG